MNVTREAISTALFNLLVNTKIAGLPAFKSTSRKAKIWSNTNVGDQPAMFLIHSGEEAVQNKAYGITKWHLHFDILIYARVDASPAATPDTTINTLLDAIDTQIRGTQGERQTLGGVVHHAWIEGQILIDTGILDQQIAILVPVKILMGG